MKFQAYKDVSYVPISPIILFVGNVSFQSWNSCGNLIALEEEGHNLFMDWIEIGWNGPWLPRRIFSAGENYIITILPRKRKPGTEIGLAHSLIFLSKHLYELLSISLLVFLFYVVRHFRLFLLNNFYFDILHLYNIVIPIITSVTL